MFSALLCIIFGSTLAAFLARWRDRFSPNGPKTAVIAVLGDLGRSPRMLAHTVALSKHLNDNSQTKSIDKIILMGYLTRPEMIPSYVKELRNVSIVDAGAWSKNSRFLQSNRLSSTRSQVVQAIRKICLALFNMACLLYTLVTTRHLKLVMLQSPPTVPLSVFLGVMCCIRGTKLVIDVHNFGFTILSLGTGPLSNEYFLTVFKFVEILGLRLAHRRLCVSDAMSQWLLTKQKLSSTVLYDRPLFLRGSTTPDVRSKVLNKYLRLNDQLPPPDQFAPPSPQAPDRSSSLDKLMCPDAGGLQPLIPTTPLAENSSWILEHLETRKIPLLVTSSSFTPDEDLYLLLRAAQLYAKLPSARPICILITGTGPLKEEFIQEAAHMAASDERFSQFIHIRMAYASADDYWSLLGSADLGISLHFSSSKLDLPMKIVDMSSTALPYLSSRYDTIYEVCTPLQGEIEFDPTFLDAKELAAKIMACLDGWPKSPILEALRQHQQPAQLWDSQWKEQILPIVTGQLVAP